MLCAGWPTLAVSLVAIFQAAYALPLSDDNHRRRQNAPQVVTETVISTIVETSTTTTYATIASPAAADATYSGSTSVLAASSAMPASDSIQPTSAASVSTAEPVLVPAPTSVSTSSVQRPASNTAGESLASPTTSALPPPSTSDPASSTQDPSLPVFSGGGQPQKIGHRPSPSPKAPSNIRPQVMAYYPDWTAEAFPPERVDFNRFDWIDFAFAVPTEDFTLAWDGSDNAPELLQRLVTNAHQNGKHVKLSVGGWTGSK